MNLKITQMTPASSISGSEYFPLVQGGINKRAAIDDLKGILNSNVPTISDLKGKPGKTNNETIEVLGYYSRFDGGGGIYYWNSSSTATDDGGSVISVLGVSTGRWIAVFHGDIVNVKQFGAKGDGVQDDLQSMEKAASYCGRANRNLTLFFPNGVYRITDQWVVGAKIVPVETELVQVPYYSAPSINYGVESNWRPFKIKGSYDSVVHADFSSDTLKSAIYYCIRLNTGTSNRDEFGGEISYLKIVGQGSYIGNAEQTLFDWQYSKNQCGITIVSGIGMKFENLYFKNMHRGMILNTSYNAKVSHWVANYVEYGWYEIGSNTGNRNMFHCFNYEVAYEVRSGLLVWDGMWAEGVNTVLKLFGNNNTIKGFYNEAHDRALDNDKFVIELGMDDSDPLYNPDGMNGTVFDGLFLPASYVNLTTANGIRMRDGARNVTIIGGHVMANVLFDNPANDLVYVNSLQRTGNVSGSSKITFLNSSPVIKNLTLDSTISSTSDLNFNVSASNVINHRVNNQIRGTWNSNGLGLGVTASLNSRLEVSGNHKFNGNYYEGNGDVTSQWFILNFPTSSNTAYLNFGDFSGISNNEMAFDVELSSGWSTSLPTSLGSYKKNYIVRVTNTPSVLNVNQNVYEDLGFMGRVFQLGNIEFSGSLLRVPINIIDNVTGSEKRAHVRVRMTSWNGFNISRFNPALSGYVSGSLGTREYQKVNDRLGVGLGNNIQPSHSLDVSGSIRFTDSLVYNNIAYKLPLSLPATGSILVHNGAGSLGWKTADISSVNSLTDSATIVWNLGLGKNANVTLGGNRTLSIVSSSVGDYATLVVRQDGTGSRSLILPSGSKVINGGSGSISLSTVGSSVDILSCYFDGTNYYWNKGLNYS